MRFLNINQILCSVVAIFFVFYSNGFAQITNDPCGCNMALLNAVYDFRAKKGDQEALQDVLHRLATITFEEFKLAPGGGIPTVFEDFGFSANMSMEEFLKCQTELSREYQLSDTSKSNLKLLKKYGDAKVLKVWNKCNASCRIGLKSWFEISDQHNMVFNLRWTPFSGFRGDLKIVTSEISGAEVVNPYVQSGKVFNDDFIIPVGVTQRAIVRSDPLVPVNITVKVFGIDVRAFVPAFVETWSANGSVRNASVGLYWMNDSGKQQSGVLAKPLKGAGHSIFEEMSKTAKPRDGNCQVEIKFFHAVDSELAKEIKSLVGQHVPGCIVIRCIGCEGNKGSLGRINIHFYENYNSLQ